MSFLFNHTDADYVAEAGERIAQLIIERIHMNVRMVEVDELVETERGEGGFGSSGK